MSAGKTGPSGVRNLRAMFENKGSDPSNSPPSRGRSPNGAVSPSKDRPLSKVRTNFVAVKDKGEGQQPHSFLKQSPEVTMDDTREKSGDDEQGLGTILKGSPFLDHGEFKLEEKLDSQSSGLADRAATMVKKMQQGDPTNPPPVGNFTDGSAGSRILPVGPPQPMPKAQSENTSTATDKRPSANDPKAPAIKPKGGGVKILGILDSARRARQEGAAHSDEIKSKGGASKPSNQKPPANKMQQDPPLTHEAKTKQAVGKASEASEPAKKTKEVDTMVSGEPKSRPVVTKPAIVVKLPRSSLPTKKPPAAPAAAAAPNSSSIAKSEDDTPSDSRPSDRKVAKPVPRLAGVTTAASLAKKSSRASLNSNEGSKSKSTTRPADEGFLARMMRPTASSAQKSHEKVQISSPPRAKPTSGRTLNTKASRRSLNTAGENKENETNDPPVPPVPRKAGAKPRSLEPQQAEVTSST